MRSNMSKKRANGLKIAGMILLLWMIPSNSFSAIDADMAWEVRTSGDDTNGGCYDLGDDGGTDYTQQDSAQLSLTDLAMTTGGTTLTSSTGGFTSAMVDNCIHINSGTNFTAGYYEITGYTDTNTVTIDRDATTGSNGSSGNGKVGGAVATLDEVTGNVVAGNKIYIASGTYNELFTTSVAGGAGTPIRWIGYNSSRGDEPKLTDRPVIDGQSTRTNCVNAAVDNHSFENLIFKNATGRCVGGGRDYRFVNSRITNCGSDAMSADEVMVVGSEIDNATSDGFYSTSGTRIYIYFSYVHDNGDEAIGSGGSAIYAYNTIADSNSDDGFRTWQDAYDIHIINCIAYNNGSGASSAGFYLQTENADNMRYIILNSIAVDNNNYGFYRRYTTLVGPYFDYNLYNGNTTDDLYQITAGANDVTSAPAFVDAAAGDFTFESGSPALDAGFDIGDYLNVTGAYKQNIGIDQDDNSTGGGSVTTGYGFAQ